MHNFGYFSHKLPPSSIQVVVGVHCNKAGTQKHIALFGALKIDINLGVASGTIDFYIVITTSILAQEIPANQRKPLNIISCLLEPLRLTFGHTVQVPFLWVEVQMLLIAKFQ